MGILKSRRASSFVVFKLYVFKCPLAPIREVGEEASPPYMLVDMVVFSELDCEGVQCLMLSGCEVLLERLSLIRGHARTNCRKYARRKG